MRNRERRRWFQVSLGTLLWLMALLAVAMYAVKERRARIAAEEKLEELSLPDALLPPHPILSY